MTNRNVIVSWGSFTDVGRLTQNDINNEIQMAFNSYITDGYNNVIDLNFVGHWIPCLKLQYSIRRAFQHFTQLYRFVVFVVVNWFIFKGLFCPQINMKLFPFIQQQKVYWVSIVFVRLFFRFVSFGTFIVLTITVCLHIAQHFHRKLVFRLFILQELSCPSVFLSRVSGKWCRFDIFKTSTLNVL
jgi:hypothetical protein